MKKLDLGLCDTSNIALFTAGTIDFLQLAYKEGISASIISQIGNSYSASIIYRVYGCKYSILTNIMSAGVLFFNDEFYYCDSTFIATPTGSNVIVANLTITPFSDSLGGDPMVFTVTGNANVHNIRKSTFTVGSSGTGTLSGNSASDYNNWLDVYKGWSDTPVVSLGAIDGGTFTPGITSYSQYNVNRNNGFFKFKLINCTFSSGVFLVRIDTSAIGTFNNLNIIAGILDINIPLIVSTGPGASIDITRLDNGAFLTGIDITFCIQISGEVN